jgi:hypothetical protein
MTTTTTPVDERAAAGMIREILEAVDRGELEATTPQAKRLLRRLEGAAVAFGVAGDTA